MLYMIFFLLRTLFIFAEIFEFDVMDDPPSVMDVVVCEFDGPFNDSESMNSNEKVDEIKVKLDFDLIYSQ